MRVRRGPLFWGFLLIPLGAIPLLARAGSVSVVRLDDAWRWWPVLLVAIGVAVLVGRGRSVLVTAMVGLFLGTLGGSALASGNLWVGAIAECATGDSTSQLDRSGAFTADASVSIDIDCGSVDVTVEPGNGWAAQAAYRGPEPRVDASGSSLALRPGDADAHRHDWTVTVGSGALREVDLTVNAGNARAVLFGAAVSSVTAESNAGDLIIDGTGATIERLRAAMNAGRMRISIDGPTSGKLSVNAGVIELCVAPDADLRFVVREQLTFATNLPVRGLTQTGDGWTRQGSGPRIDLAVEGNAATFTLDPEGGCR